LRLINRKYDSKRLKKKTSKEFSQKYKLANLIQINETMAFSPKINLNIPDSVGLGVLDTFQNIFLVNKF